MLKVLIIGKNSYIGNQFLSYNSNDFDIDIIESKNNTWREKSFACYDCLLLTAGIAHIKQKKKLESLYFSVNRDLAFQIAKKAKKEKVKQFIYLSSASVYGKLDGGAISKTYPPSPQINDYYAKSKYEGEQLVSSLSGENFKVAILRVPMVYGPNCKGNFTKLVRLIDNTIFFPSLENKRSMIFIDNLSAYLAWLIKQTGSGVFWPQDADYINTKKLVQEIALNLEKRIYFFDSLNSFIKKLMPHIPVLQKLFGDLYYDESTRDDFNKANFKSVSFTKAVKLSLLPRK